MKISIYGPLPIDGAAIAELLKHIPEDAKDVLIQAPPRNAIDRRPCQHPGWLFYSASIDNNTFLHLSQQGPTARYEVKKT